MKTSWNDSEDYALQALHPATQIIYLRGMRRFMDYATGIVGVNRRISYTSLSECCEFIPDPRSRIPSERKTKSAVRAALAELERAGLIVKKSAETLIFFLPLADTNKSASNLGDLSATHERHTQNNTPKHCNGAALKGVEQPMSDTPKKNLSVTHQDTGKQEDQKKPPPLIIKLELNAGKTGTETKRGGGQFLETDLGAAPSYKLAPEERGAPRTEKLATVTVSELVFPKSLTDIERTAAEQLLAKCTSQAQAILDTLEAAILAGQVKKSALAMLGGIIRRHEAGTFDPTPGLHIAVNRSKRLVNQQNIKTSTLMDGDAAMRHLNDLQQQIDARNKNTAINARKKEEHEIIATQKKKAALKEMRNLCKIT